MIKKISILLIMLIFTLTSFTVGVFAWFTTGVTATIGEFGGQVINIDQIDIERDFQFEFHIPDLDGITYLRDEDLANPNFDYRNYATTLHMTITNNALVNPEAENDIRIKARIKLADHTIPGQYAGIKEGLMYLTYDDNGPYPEFSSNSASTTKSNVNSIIEFGVLVNPGETVVIAIDVWGYYNGLLEPETINIKTFDDMYYLHEVYYSLIYRGIITLSLN